MARPKKGAVPMPAPTESSPGVFSVWKPLDQEFYLATDHAAIAADLGVPIEQVTFTWTNEVQSGIDGHRLIGTISQ